MYKNKPVLMRILAVLAGGAMAAPMASAGVLKIGDPEVVEYVDPLIVIDAPERDGRKPKERSQPEEAKLR